MRSVLLLLLWICFVENSFAQSAAINTDGSNADASAILDVKSTNKGFLLPRMTTAQRTAIVMPALGLKVFDTDSKSFWFYNGTAWVSLYSGIPANYWTQNGDNISNNNIGNVGIGADATSYKLSVIQNGGSGGAIYLRNTNGAATINMEATGTTADTRIWMGRNNQINWIIQNEGLDNSFQIRQNGFLPNIMIEAGTGNMGIGVSDPTVKLDVAGSAKISGDLTVNNGRGIVRSTNSTQLKVFRNQITVPASTIGPGAWVETGFFDYENFSATPQVYIGNILSYSSADWMKINIMPVEVSTSGCKFRMYNMSTSTVTNLTVTYQFMVIGAE